MTSVLIGLGSNLGDRPQNLTAAWSEIENHPRIHAVRLSRFYETEPVGGPAGQPKYLNAAGIFETEMTSQELFGILQRIENQLGRIRDVYHGPRTIDLDLLLFGTELYSNETLVIPHPRMHQRIFVLEPSVEIAPDFIHPLLQKTLSELFLQQLRKK